MVLVTATVGVGVWVSGEEASSDKVAAAVTSVPVVAARVEDNPVPVSSTSLAVTTTEASLAPAAAANGVRLPVPDDLPLDPYGDAPEVVVGRISVPRLGLDEPLHQGMSLTVINRGPSHWPGTALPGQMGNVVVAGHRTTFSKPFAELDSLQPGDEITYTLSTGVYRYRVTGTEVVSAEALEIADQTPAYTTTLFACHPPGSAAYRIVARAQLLDDAGQPVPAPQVAVANPDEIRRFRS